MAGSYMHSLEYLQEYLQQLCNYWQQLYDMITYEVLLCKAGLPK